MTHQLQICLINMYCFFYLQCSRIRTNAFMAKYAKYCYITFNASKISGETTNWFTKTVQGDLYIMTVSHCRLHQQYWLSYLFRTASQPLLILLSGLKLEVMTYNDSNNYCVKWHNRAVVASALTKLKPLNYSLFQYSSKLTVSCAKALGCRIWY